MNFLAHIYLSGDDTQLKLGNYIADSVKGSTFKNYSEGIQKGILLHRFIDQFTDTHLVVKKSKNKLRDKYAKYAGVIVDIFYDHFLAKQWADHSPVALNKYSSDTYQLLNEHHHIMPLRSQQFLQYAIRYDILTNYSNLEGIKQVLYDMSRRAKFNSRMNEATSELELYYPEFEKEFNLFFPELKAESLRFLNLG